jgi:thiosulfate/3-mercaptopyruvate sulfurtransferase
MYHEGIEHPVFPGEIAMTHSILIALVTIHCVPAVVVAETGGNEYPRSDLLIEPAALAPPLDAERFVILDSRSREDYQQEHIPEARWVDHGAWSKTFGDGEDVEAWSQRIGELGIDTDAAVVVYDDQAMKNAARIWWILRYWGVEDVRLLNGGWKSWKAQELPVSQARGASVEPVAFTAKPQSSRLATKSQILDRLEGQEWQIVDARSEAEYCGTELLGNQRAGAIPGAKHLEWSELIDPETDRFRPPDELRELFDQANIDLDRPMASHCQSGGRASVMAFGLELMGAEGVRNYYRGWSDWGNAEDTPVEPGKRPASP